MEKILPISLKLDFTSNTLGCYGLIPSYNIFLIPHGMTLPVRKEGIFILRLNLTLIWYIIPLNSLIKEVSWNAKTNNDQESNARIHPLFLENNRWLTKFLFKKIPCKSHFKKLSVNVHIIKSESYSTLIEFLPEFSGFLVTFHWVIFLFPKLAHYFKAGLYFQGPAVFFGESFG